MSGVRLLFWALHAATLALDAGATLCGAAVTVLFALASALALPFALAARGCLALSRRIAHGAPPRPAAPSGDRAP